MQFKIRLIAEEGGSLPFNYQYPLSAAIYKILAKGDKDYAQFLHEEGYGKGYKFFTFSDLRLKFKKKGDRMQLLDKSVSFRVHFQLPEASQTFIQGLFQSEKIVIADKHSKVCFDVQSVIAQPPLFKTKQENELLQITTRPISALVAGSKKVDGNYSFLSPDNEEYTSALVYSWRNKIKEAFDVETAENAMLVLKTENYHHPFRSRLLTIKADTNEATQIRGFLNFKLLLTAEKRFLNLALNAGMGLYSAQGCGCLEVEHEVTERKIVKHKPSKV